MHPANLIVWKGRTMNAEQANEISLISILDLLGISAVKKKSNEVWYLSPFRKENTASFHVNISRNIWFDHGEAKGGTVVDFVCMYLKSHCESNTVVDALRWLKNMHPSSVTQFSQPEEEADQCVPGLDLRKLSALQNPLFISYLNTRGIHFPLAKKYLKEATIYNKHTGKSFQALCLRNENGGYELRNKFFKGCIAPKGISFIRGSKFLPEEIHVFEGLMDFLSALMHEKKSQFEGDVIILNSISCLKESFIYIGNYSYKTIYTWLDNDVAGKNATKALYEFAKHHGDLKFSPMNKIYTKHKDINDWLTNKPKP